MKSVSAQRDVFIASHAAGEMREMEEEEVKRGMPSPVTQPCIAPLWRASVLTAERRQSRRVPGSGGKYKNNIFFLLLKQISFGFSSMYRCQCTVQQCHPLSAHRYPTLACLSISFFCSTVIWEQESWSGVNPPAPRLLSKSSRLCVVLGSKCAGWGWL